ncbi:MAG: epoxide hydrolase family protein [Thermomicrobiales bacterium]
MTSIQIERLEIRIDDSVLDDLRDRLRRTRWIESAPGPSWGQGTDLGYLRHLTDYWLNEFDWRSQERHLNSFDHFITDLGGTKIHFVHARAKTGVGIPLVLTHGWPSTFAEYLPLVPLLIDPEAHGIDGPAFDLVIPSLPGYGFSERPSRTGITTRSTGRLWHDLMRRLGYKRYGAGGGDFGSAVSTFMALDHPEPLLGIHLTNLDLSPHTGAGSRPLSATEEQYLDKNNQWSQAERGYSSIQSTKPQTLGYGLNDSPVGLAAWLVEKWRSWTDSAGDVDRTFTRDHLLTTITLYWATQTIASSMRDYVDNKASLIGPDDFVRTPTAIALFDHEFVSEGSPPREWAERLYNVQRWTNMPRGGHFAPAEEPELLAQDIAKFFGTLQ